MKLLQDHKLNLNPELHRLPVHLDLTFTMKSKNIALFQLFGREGYRHAVPCPAPSSTLIMRCLLGNNENGPELLHPPSKCATQSRLQSWLRAISKVKPAPFFPKHFLYIDRP